MTKVSVSYEHRAAFNICYQAAIKLKLNNKRLYTKQLREFKREIEEPLLQLLKNKLVTFYRRKTLRGFPIEFQFFLLSKTGVPGSTFFLYPGLSFVINFNTTLRQLYKQDLKLFCLALADIYTHELLHGIQYMKQEKSIGKNFEFIRETIFGAYEYLLEKDSRFKLKLYKEDLLYFSSYDEINCYAKDAARQLLTVYQDKKIVLAKLSNTETLLELSSSSDCFYYYYDCFYSKPILPQYLQIWKRFIKYLYFNLHEEFSI